MKKVLLALALASSASAAPAQHVVVHGTTQILHGPGYEIICTPTYCTVRFFGHSFGHSQGGGGH